MREDVAMKINLPESRVQVGKNLKLKKYWYNLKLFSLPVFNFIKHPSVNFVMILVAMYMCEFVNMLVKIRFETVRFLLYMWRLAACQWDMHLFEISYVFTGLVAAFFS